MSDANTIVSAALRRNSIPDKALKAGAVFCRVTLSTAVEDEVRAVLSRPKFDRGVDPARKQAILDLMTTGALRTEPVERVRECRDPGDDKYLELALAASADIIVSGDQDLLVLDPWRGVRVLSPAAFVALWDDPAP